jgi:ADP-ribose pyrophosphatase YjhB (NUDIX family)
VTLFGVGAVVRSADGLVLVGRRRAEAGEPLAVPGGKPEAGETVEECAVEGPDLMVAYRAARNWFDRWR